MSLAVIQSSPRPLIRIDEALQRLSNLSRLDSEDVFTVALDDLATGILLHLRVHPESWAAQTRETIFDSSLTDSQCDFVAVCLLRLLAATEIPFEDVVFRNRVFELFDARFSGTLYKDLKLSEKVQTHEKHRVLKEVVPRVELSIRQAVTNARDISSQSLQVFARTFFDAFRRREAHTILAPFLPDVRAETDLRDLITHITSYRSADTPTSARHYHDRALLIGTNLLSAAESAGTTYARHIIDAPVAELLNSLRQHFASSPFSLLPNLRVTGSEKKYPFHLPKQSIMLAIDVENLGPGYAYDLSIATIDVTDAKVITPQLGNCPPLRS